MKIIIIIMIKIKVNSICTVNSTSYINMKGKDNFFYLRNEQIHCIKNTFHRNNYFKCIRMSTSPVYTLDKTIY